MDPGPRATPLMAFDGDCGFCRTWISYGAKLTGDRIRYAAYQQIAADHPEVPIEEFRESVVLLFPGGPRLRAAHAVFRALAEVPGYRWLLFLYRWLPGFAPVTEFAYRVVAHHRSIFFRVTKLFWGARPEPPEHNVVAGLFLRMLAVVYFFAFLSFALQAPGLVGSHGILPVGHYFSYLKAHGSFFSAPSLLWFSPSDTMLVVLGWGGVALSVLLFFGLFTRPVLVLLLAGWLSLVVGGQIFLGYQWDNLLLEAGFLAIFLRRSRLVPWLYRLLLLKLLFLSGMVKLLSGDRTWHGLTALTYHYWTQPLPTVVGWYAAHLPRWFQEVSCAGVFFLEIAVPFAIFLPRRPRMLGAGLIAFLMALIALTGNYTYFNLLAVSIALFLLDDQFLRRFVPRWLRRRAGWRPLPRALRISGGVLTGLVTVAWIGTSTLLMANTLGARVPPVGEAVLSRAYSVRLVNSYGLFAVMTTERPVIQVEGSDDGEHWRPYRFRYETADPKQAPRWVEPFQPRLDWQMWFAALSDPRHVPWFGAFLAKLLEGSPDVLELLEKNPFPGDPPRFVRATIWLLTPTTLEDRSRTGAWWHRKRLGVFWPPCTLRNP